MKHISLKVLCLLLAVALLLGIFPTALAAELPESSGQPTETMPEESTAPFEETTESESTEPAQETAAQETAPSTVGDEMISDLSDFSRSLILSIDILPVPTDEAVKEVQSQILGIETDITRWQQRQNSKNNFTANVPYELEQLRNETREFLDDLTVRDQRMMFAVVTLVHVADTLKQLDADTETLLSIGREHLCQFAVLRYQQEDGLNTVLPYGLRRVKSLRTLTTESTAVLMPFRAQEIQDPGGLYYGVNAVSKNLLICDRKRLISPHAFYLGVSGSGKSMAMKSTIANIALATNDDIIIIDAEREYGPLTRALGGEVIEISPHSPHHINPLDIADGYGDGENPIAMKSEVITSILEQQMGVGMVHGSHKSIIDRCTANIYRPFLHAKGKPPTPLLSDWWNKERYQFDPAVWRAQLHQKHRQGHRIWVRGRYPGAHLGDRHGASQFHIALFQK